MSKRKRANIRFQLAFKHHQAGQLTVAELIYRDVLKIDPAYPFAHNNLGNVLRNQGKFDEAEACFRRAIQLKSNCAFAYNNLGNVLRDKGMLDEAEACFRKAIRIDSAYAEPHNNLGNVLAEHGKVDEAEACFRQAIQLKPDYAFAHNNLGNVLRNKGKLDEAEASFRRAVQLKPDYAFAYNNLGDALRNKGKLDEAEACLRRAIQLMPAYAFAYNNLGNVHGDQGKIDQAEACFRQAIHLKPDYAFAHANLGNVLSEKGKLEEAEACFQLALKVDSKFAEAHYALGNVLQAQNRLDEAISCYEKSLVLNSDNTDALSQYVNCANRSCRWKLALSGRENLISQSTLSHFSGATFPLLCIVDDPAIALTAVKHARKNGKLYEPAFFTRDRPSHSKIRLAYLSADYREHATSYLMAELFERHDRSQFELYAIAFGPDDQSPTRKRVIEAFDQFIDVSQMSDREAAQKIHDLEIDIAVDLMGYTKDNRLNILAYRPAPIQVNYLGYPGTTGADFIDYIIVDHFVVPAEHQQFFTEKLVHLPDCYQVNDTKRPNADRTPSRVECGLPEASFVFCSFNNTIKYTPEVFNIWMRLLRSVPDSILWLYSNNKFAEENLRREAQARDVDPDRLVFARWVARPEHLARYRLADLFLDTLPYNAHTTASDALWEGVPVLTCTGRSFPARVAGSLLRAIGLPELITHSLEEYEALAFKLATNPQELATAKRILRQNRMTSPLFDTDRFRRHLEAAYLRMWEIRNNGGEPTSFAVPAQSA